MGYDEIHDVRSLVSPRGLSGDSLNKLPHHMVLKGMKAEDTFCAICLQVIILFRICDLMAKKMHLLALILATIFHYPYI